MHLVGDVIRMAGQEFRNGFLDSLLFMPFKNSGNGFAGEAFVHRSHPRRKSVQTTVARITWGIYKS